METIMNLTMKIKFKMVIKTVKTKEILMGQTI